MERRDAKARRDGRKNFRMDEPKEGNLNLKWVVIVILLMIGIDGLLTRLLESLWVSLERRNSPTYLPLEWWMSAPFTLFVFVVLSALLTSFSGAKNWLKTFLLLCGCKVVFSGVTAFFFLFRPPYPNLAEAAVQAAVLSLPSVLVHILLSGMIVLFLRDVFVRELTKEEPTYPFLATPEGVVAGGGAIAAVEERQEARLGRGLAEEREEAPRGTRGEAEEKYVLLPVSEILKAFPSDELAMSPSQIAEISPSVRISLEQIIPQLSEGRVVVEAVTVISSITPEAFTRPPEEVAMGFPNGMIELPLREVVSRVGPGILELPEQELQPNVDAEFSDFFLEAAPPEAPPEGGEELEEEPALAPAAISGVPLAEPLPQGGAEEVTEAAREVSEDALVLSEEERLLFERSRDVVTVSTEAIISQFPQGAVSPDNSAQAGGLPETIVVPLELIILQLAGGELRLHAKYIFPQFPENCLSISELEVVRSLPNGEVELPLREVVPQLPPEIFAAPPDQAQQPTLDEMLDPFHEEAGVRPVGEGALSQRREGRKEEVGELEAEEAPPSARDARRPPERQPTPEPAPRQGAVSVQPRRGGVPSYADMLREENALDLSVNTVVHLLPEGAFCAPVEELKRYVGGETVKVPRSMVMGQLKEGRVVVPVEILTTQFLPDHFGMSIEQIKARFAEGLVELPLPELVGQVIEEIARPPEGFFEQQPECDEISTPFQEMPSEPAMPHGDRRGLVSERMEEGRGSRRDQESGVSAVRSELPAQRSPVMGVTTQQSGGRGEGALSQRRKGRKEEGEGAPRHAGLETGRTIVHTLLQKCKGLGVSGHVWFAAGESSAVVLAPSSLDRESVVSGTVELMAQMRGFCGDYHLGEPLKLIVYSNKGVVVGRELVRGDPDRFIILASLNRSGAGTMSLLLDRFETQLRDLPSLMGSSLGLPQVRRAVNLEVKKTPLRRDGLPEKLCLRIVAALSDVGAERYFSASTPSGHKVVAVGGEDFGVDTLLTGGIFNIESLSRYPSDVGVGEFESLLLVTQHASVTLNRSLADPSAYLLCFFSRSFGEGLVRAKAAKAVKLLET